MSSYAVEHIQNPHRVVFRGRIPCHEIAAIINANREMGFDVCLTSEHPYGVKGAAMTLARSEDLKELEPKDDNTGEGHV